MVFCSMQYPGRLTLHIASAVPNVCNGKYIILNACHYHGGSHFTNVKLVGTFIKSFRCIFTCRKDLFLRIWLITMNLLSLYPVDFTWFPRILPGLLLNTGGFFTGIFVGCLAGALAEVINIIPILSRRIQLRKGFPYFIMAAAFSPSRGALI